MNRIRSFIPIVFIIVLWIFIRYMGWGDYLTLDALRENYDSIRGVMDEHQIASVFLFMLVYIAVVALSIPGAAIMSLSAGLFFGQLLGTVVTVISATIGASLLFFSARLVSTHVLKDRVGKWLNRLRTGFQGNAFLYLLSLRLIPAVPFVVINLAAALLEIPFRIFFWGTLIGIIPGSFVYVSAGVAMRTVLMDRNVTVQTLIDPTVLIALSGLGVLSLMPILWKKMKKVSSDNPKNK